MSQKAPSVDYHKIMEATEGVASWMHNIVRFIMDLRLLLS